MPNSFQGTLPQRLQCLLGLVVFILLAYGVGVLRRVWKKTPAAPFPWRALAWGLALQFLFALVVLRTPNLLVVVNDAITALLGFTRDGARMVFGNLANAGGAPVSVTGPGGATLEGYADTGAYFAFF